MNLNLNNKVIVITGGAKGIGKGIADVLAGEGATAVVVGRNARDNKSAVDEIIANGGSAFAVEGELNKPEECTRVIQDVVNKFGRIDGLVNNAGVNDGVSLEQGDYTAFV